MTTANRRKGSEYEVALVGFFNQQQTFGHEVFRAPRWGAADKGDLVNTRDFTIQAKNRKEMNLAGWVTEAQEQARNAGKRWGVAVVKRRNHSVGRSYAVMELSALAALIKEYYQLKST